MRKQNPGVISLFSGCGGSSLGYKMAGFDVKLAVEFDDNAVETYKNNFPNTDIFHGDILELTVEEIIKRTGLRPEELDVLDGSPPCQGFSTAGKRNVDDPRNRLFEQYVRILKGMKPKAFVMENVSGMVKGKMKFVFNEILKEFHGAGYDVACRTLNAKWYGVPQSRERIIFIGIRKDLGIRPTHPTPTTTPISCGKSLNGLVLDKTEHAWLLEEGAKRSSFKYWHLISRGMTNQRAAKKFMNKNTNLGMNCIKVDPRKPAPTIAKSDGHMGMQGTMHWSEKRRFAVAEYKRFFGYPDDFIFAGKWNDAVSRMGNSVPPPFMKAIANHVRNLVQI